MAVLKRIKIALLYNRIKITISKYIIKFEKQAFSMRFE